MKEHTHIYVRMCVCARARGCVFTLIHTRVQIKVNSVAKQGENETAVSKRIPMMEKDPPSPSPSPPSSKFCKPGRASNYLLSVPPSLLLTHTNTHTHLTFVDPMKCLPVRLKYD